jgi:hypothetical protein
MSIELEQAIERAAKSINKAHEYVDGWRSRGNDAYAAGNAKVGAFRLDSADYLEEMAAATAALVRLVRTLPKQQRKD